MSRAEDVWLVDLNPVPGALDAFVPPFPLDHPGRPSHEFLDQMGIVGTPDPERRVRDLGHSLAGARNVLGCEFARYHFNAATTAPDAASRSMTPPTFG